MIEDEINDNFSSRSMPNPETCDERSVIQGLYDQMCNLEYHYDNLQNATKAFSMTWLAAGFLGVAYILKNYDIASIFSEPIELFFIFNLVAFGFYIQWFSDVCIYHRQLKAVFLSQLEYEEKFPFLKNTHHKMSYVLENRKKRTDPVMFHAQFYLRIVLSLVSLSILTILPYALDRNFSENIVLKFSAYVIVSIHLLFIAVLLTSSKKSGATYEFFTKK